MKSRSIDSFKRVGFRTWVIRLVTLLGVPLVLYTGYCGGLWGRQSLLLQYLFQCNCPSASQEARYPRAIDVLVSACSHAGSILSPGGRLLAVYENEPPNASPFILDLQTGEKNSFVLPENSHFYFLTDNLLFVSLSYRENYVLDRTTGTQYPIQRFSALRPDAYVGGQTDLLQLADALRQAKYVFFREQDDSVIALAADFPTSADKSFFIRRFDIPDNRTEAFLQQNGLAYQTLIPYFPEEVVSPDGKFVARPDGIYLLQTGQRIVEGPYTSRFYRPYSGKYFSIRGWTYDGTAAIYSEIFGPCLIETALITIDPACFIKVPQPVLKLKVPEEYILPNEIQ